MDECFPMVTTRIRSDDPPWMTNGIRKKIDQRKEVYDTDKKRTDRWRHMKELTNRLIKEKKTEFIETIKKKAVDQKSTSMFYKAVTMFKDHEQPPKWDLTDLFPGEPALAAAEQAADFFNSISSEFQPVSMPTHGTITEVWRISKSEIVTMLKESKKPNSRVAGDIFSDLISPNAEILATPLCDIFNAIIQTRTWPDVWKNETVVVIPKQRNPDSLSQCRNLSCTPFFSKILERFIFARINREVKLSTNQYGGQKGCGVDHMLVDMWETILNDLDRGSAASCLISLDFEKAFNRLDHDACIRSLIDHGASPLSVELIRAFLTNRKMQVRVDDVLSAPRAVNGGSPQGSILGNLLFTITTDKISDDISYAKPDLNIADLASEQLSADHLDLGLARIVNDSQSSCLGINNITVVADQPELPSLTFSDNGTSSDSNPEISYYNHPEFVQSTPTQRGQFASFIPPGNLITSCLSGEYSSTTGLTFVYMPGHKKGAVLADSEEDCIQSALLLSNTNPEINSDATDPPQWHQRPPLKTYTYIDDTNGSERLNLNNALVKYTANKQEQEIHAKNCERFFNGVAANSDELGMKINSQKTQLLAISAAGYPGVSSFVRLGDEKVASKGKLKICGYHFGANPTVEEQVSVMERCWALRNLRRSGFNKADLLTVYKALIRPVFDFAAVAYHSLLTGEQTKFLERLQRRALRIIDQNFSTYEDSLANLGLPTLQQRRLDLVDGFVQKALNNPRFSGRWFPEKSPHGYDTRHEHRYVEYKCNTQSLRNSPLNFFRRRLNKQLNDM